MSTQPERPPSTAQLIGSEVFAHAKGLRDRTANGTEETARFKEQKTEQGDVRFSLHRSSAGSVALHITIGGYSHPLVISEQQTALLICEALSGFVRSF